MKKRILLWAIPVALISLFSSCNGGDEPIRSKGNYIIAASSDEATYLLQSESIKEGVKSILGNGTEVETATAWIYHNNKYLYRLVYNQGNAGTGSSYYIDSNGFLQERSIAFEITNRFTNYGSYGKYVITAASGATAEKEAGSDLPKYGVTFTYLDTEAQTLATKTVVTENITGNGEYYTVSGIVEKDGKLYTALCPEGLSEYGVSKGYAKYPELITDGALKPSQYPDSVWIAIYNGIDFDNPKIISDDRISYATSRYRSQFYSTLATDATGNLYVFSSSNTVSNEGIQKTSKPSGVIRIKAGAEAFDDYYCNIEELSGGKRFFKVWHIAEDYFLLQMFADPKATSAMNADTKLLAIFKAGESKYTEVTGMPDRDKTGSLGSFPYFENGLAYIPVVTLEGEFPTIYEIDPKTATAKKGLVVEYADGGISAVGKLVSLD